MVVKTILCAALLVALSTQAHALCRDDLKELKPSIDHVKTSNPQRYYLALRWWGKAQEAEPGSETECLNFLAKARKALVDPLPQYADCTGPNAYLPVCQNGGMQNADFGMTPVGPVQALGGGGGGLGGATQPVTTGPGTPFNPPGSPGAPGPGPQATGNER